VKSIIGTWFLSIKAIFGFESEKYLNALLRSSPTVGESRFKAKILSFAVVISKKSLCLPD
jgi:hypothetical protein